MTFFTANLSESPSLTPQNPIYQTFHDTYNSLINFSVFTMDLNKYLRAKSPRLYLVSDILLTEIVSGLVDEPAKALELILAAFPGLKRFIYETKHANSLVENNSGKFY